jgi:hypothetical protein
MVAGIGKPFTIKALSGAKTIALLANAFRDP